MSDTAPNLEHNSLISEQQNQVTKDQEHILNASVQFVHFLTSKYPQVDDGRVLRVKPVEGDDRVVHLPTPDDENPQERLNYYISGSLAAMLLSQVNHFDHITVDDDAHMHVTGTVQVSPRARTILASFARPIGDLDFVKTNFYGTHYTYEESLQKGGGGPSFNQIPDYALPALKREENMQKLSCDPVENYGPLQAARITLEGQDFYVSTPDAMLSYKILHLLMSGNQKVESINRDFPIILSAIQEMYCEDHARKAVYDLLKHYEEWSAEGHIVTAEYWRNSTYISETTKMKMAGKIYDPYIPGHMKSTLEIELLSPTVKGFLNSLRELDSEGIVFGGI